MPVSFEENLEKLESIVKSLEDGNTTLNDSLKAFEKGIKLSKICQKELDGAEKKVTLLIKDGNEITGTKPFEV